MGVKECWSFAEAKMAKRKAVSVNQRPPWTQEAHWKLNCYTQSGYIYVGERVTS